MRQQYFCDRANRYDRDHGEPFIIHICDRCGAEIGEIDSIIYSDVSNREGGALAHLELCKSCASQLYEWMRGADIALDETLWDE